MKKLGRRQLRSLIMKESRNLSEGYKLVGPGLEIFQSGPWAGSDWRYVWDSSIKQVLEPLIAKGMTADQILAGIKPHQEEKIRAVLEDLGALQTSGYVSTGPSTDDALSTQELYVLFKAGFTGDSLAGINKSNLTHEMRSALEKAP